MMVVEAVKVTVLLLDLEVGDRHCGGVSCVV